MRCRLATPLIAASLVVAAIVGLAPGAEAQVAGCGPAGSTRVDADSVLITNYVNDSQRRTGTQAGCVTSLHRSNGSAEFVSAVAGEGWSFDVKASGGTSDRDRIIVEFRHESGSKVTYRIERGRLDIR